MKKLESIAFTSNQFKALDELRQRLLNKFDILTIILFGSYAREEADLESDIDLLIVTRKHFKRPARHKITDIVFEINLKYDTNFSTVVVDQISWEKGAFSVLPFHEEIIQEGIPL